MNLRAFRSILLVLALCACQPSAAAVTAPATATRALPTAANCNPGYASTMKKVYLTGWVYAGPVVDATVRLYTLEAGGRLSPLALDRQICTAADGSYQTPALPAEVDGKTLVIEASGGSFVDEASGQTVSFEGHSLYAVIPEVKFMYPLDGVVTPLTDMAFRLAQHSLSADPGLAPSSQANYYNFWIGKEFLGESEGVPNQPGRYPPAILYDEQKNPQLNKYAQILAGFSQEALDAGISPVDWIAQLSADADDGNLDSAARQSIQSLPAAIDKFMAGPRNPLPFKSMTTSTP